MPAIVANPLRVDPTRTRMLRERFARDFRIRFQQLMRDITQLIVEENALGLVANTRWEGFRDDVKLQEFEGWIKTQVDNHIFDGVQDVTSDQWWDQYIRQARFKGMERAFNSGKQMGMSEESKGSFLMSSFNNPPSIERVKLMASRTFNDISGLTDTMRGSMRNELVDGFIRGDSPGEIAKALNERVSAIGIARAERIARTEIIRNFADGQLDAFEQMGLKTVGVNVEFNTAKNRVCPQCAKLNSRVFTLEEARGVIPVHPNCRCCFVATSSPVTNSRLVFNSGCGTGSGGFQPGNDCAKGGWGSKLLHRLTQPLTYGNFCGPGGFKFGKGGTPPNPVSKLDSLCMKHDQSYADAGATWRSGTIGGKRSRRTIKADLQLIKDIDALIPTLKGNDLRAAHVIRSYFRLLHKISKKRTPVTNADCGTGAGGFKPGNTCAKGGRSVRGKRYHVPATLAVQRSSDAIEHSVARALGMQRTSGNSPMDCVTLDGTIGLEVKVLHRGKKSRAEMRKDSRQRKESWVSAVKGRKAFTLVVDNRDRFNGGEHKARYSGTRYHVKSGVGAFRFNSMVGFDDLNALKAYIGL